MGAANPIWWIFKAELCWEGRSQSYRGHNLSPRIINYFWGYFFIAEISFDKIGYLI